MGTPSVSNCVGGSGGLSLFVPVTSRGLTEDYLLDSGCDHTTIAYATYKSIPENQRPTLTPLEREPALADGTLLESWGAAWMEVEVGGVCMTVKVRVCNIDVPGILGMDYLTGQGCSIDFQRYELVVKGIRVKCKSSNGGFFCARLVVTETKVVLPGHETCLVTRAKDRLWNYDPKQANENPIGMVEPLEISPLPEHDIMIARSVVTVGDSVLVPVCNFGQKTRKVKVGTVIASVSPVEICNEGKRGQVCMTNETLTDPCDSEKVQDEFRVPEHLQDLLTDSIDCVPSQYIPQIESLLCRYADVFSRSDDDIGCTSLVKHKIDTGDAKPVKQRPRRVPQAQQEEIDNQIQGLLDRGLISPSDSPWSSQVTLAMKKDGKYRLCLDLRKVNALTKKDSYPLPRIDDSIDALSGAQWFCTLDLSSGYWQVELDESAREKTAFAVKGGLYCWNVMPFGLCNAPGTFERLMERVLRGLHWKTLLVYLDDIVTFGATVPETISRLEEVFERLRSAGLKLKPRKCQLFQKEVHYLGFIVSSEGVRTEPEKVQCVKEWPTPTCVKDVRSFVGLVAYYRRFIANFSKIAKPLYKLTEKNCEFVWSVDCESAFQQLKECLINAPILAYPKAEGQYILDCDASAYAIGGVLSQEQDDLVKVIAYGSRTLQGAERNYCVTRKELLAVVYFLKYYRHYLYGRKVIVRSDHGALRWLLNFKDPQGQVARWLEVLGEYDIELIHRPGLKHGNADALSRQSCKQCGRIDDDSKESAPTMYGNKVSAPFVETMSEEKNDKQVNTTNDDNVANDDNVRTVKVNPLLTLAEIRAAQLEEPSMRLLLVTLEEGAPKPEWNKISHCVPDLKTYCAQWDLLGVKDGVLCRKWVSTNSDEVKWKVMIPPKLRKFVLENAHGTKAAGHLGQKKTLQCLQEKYYWSRMVEDVRSWLRQCTKCAKRKDPPRKRRAKLRQYQVGGPLERVALDILGPLPETESGNKYILVIGDYFTKYMEALPIPDQRAETVANVFVKEFVCRYGMPMELHSDQGSNFQSEVFKETLQLLGVSQTRTCSYNPKSDGMIERYNRTLLNLVSTLIEPNKNQRDWDTVLPFAGYAYRSTVQESTGETPNMLMFGREIATPLDLLVENVHDDKEQTDYAQELRDNLRSAHAQAREALKKSARRQKKQYDRKAYSGRLSIQEGSFVWVYDHQRKPGISKKLKLPWEGPYLVVKKLSDVHCKIQRSPRSKYRIVHMDRLKPYEGSDLKNWSSGELKTTDDLPTNVVSVSDSESKVTKKADSAGENIKNSDNEGENAKNGDIESDKPPRRNPERKRQPPVRYR